MFIKVCKCWKLCTNSKFHNLLGCFLLLVINEIQMHQKFFNDFFLQKPQSYLHWCRNWEVWIFSAANNFGAFRMHFDANFTHPNAFWKPYGDARSRKWRQDRDKIKWRKVKRIHVEAPQALRWGYNTESVTKLSIIKLVQWFQQPARHWHIIYDCVLAGVTRKLSYHKDAPWKLSGVPKYACGYFLRNSKWAFLLIDAVNIRTKFEVRSFTRSWDK